MAPAFSAGKIAGYIIEGEAIETVLLLPFDDASMLFLGLRSQMVEATMGAEVRRAQFPALFAWLPATYLYSGEV